MRNTDAAHGAARAGQPRCASLARCPTHSRTHWTPKPPVNARTRSAGVFATLAHDVGGAERFRQRDPVGVMAQDDDLLGAEARNRPKDTGSSETQPPAGRLRMNSASTSPPRRDRPGCECSVQEILHPPRLARRSFVVRCSRRTPNRSSRRNTLLPTTDLDRPMRSAAEVKLFASAT